MGREGYLEELPNFGDAAFCGFNPPQKIPAWAQWSLPMVCRWEGDPSPAGPVAIETPSGKEGPHYIRVPDGLFEPQGLSEKQVTIVVVNPALKDEVVYPGQKADVAGEADMVTLKAKPDTPPLDLAQFFFRDSPAPEAWKAKLCEQLQKRTNVFSLHEWDVGKARENIKFTSMIPVLSMRGSD